MLLGFVYVGAWWAVFLTRQEPDDAIAVGAVVLTSALLGGLTGRWWALLAPVLVLPVVAVPAAYTPGAAPEYGIGALVGSAFVILGMPSTALGVAVSARRSRRRSARGR